MKMNIYDPQRRTMLRETLVVGLAFVLSGYKIKQAESASDIHKSPTIASDSPAKSAHNIKMSKAKAEYQEKPSGDRECAKCIQYIAKSNTCKAVEGKISPQGWCILWAGR
jgi:hypothetical protein